MGKKKLAPNGQGGHGRGTQTTQVSKKIQERMEQMKKKWKSPEFQKQQHQRAMNDWLEGERRLNENIRKHQEYWRKQNQISIEQKLKEVYGKMKPPKKQPKLVCNLKANTMK